MLKTVTITGADDSIDPRAILEISKDYPFVEWGILCSAKQMGKTRFPSAEWFEDFAMEYFSLHVANQDKVKLSLHLCDGYVRDLLEKGTEQFAIALGSDVWEIFKRVQLNTHGEPHTWSIEELNRYIRSYPEKEFIFQNDGLNEELFQQIILQKEPLGDYIHKNVSTLFDLSHGAGILPSSWPKIIPGTKAGYAGGLGPDNLETQIALILEAAGSNDIWIDMETKVRSEYDQKFDVDKVIKCLEISKPFITS